MTGGRGHSVTARAPPHRTRHTASTPPSLPATINDALDWLDDHPDAETTEYDDQLKAIEQVANPIMRELYQAGAGAGAGGGDGDEGYSFEDDDL